jgi:hypothetical protein
MTSSIEYLLFRYQPTLPKRTRKKLVRIRRLRKHQWRWKVNRFGFHCGGGLA